MCMCMCMCMCMYVCMYVYIYIYIYICCRRCAHRVGQNIKTRKCVYIYIYIYMYVNDTCIVMMCVYIYIYTHTYTYIHTHTHGSSPSREPFKSFKAPKSGCAFLDNAELFQVPFGRQRISCGFSPLARQERFNGGHTIGNSTPTIT